MKPLHDISIRINFRDHNPPHFHALYGEHKAVIEINSIVSNERQFRSLAVLRDTLLPN